MPICRMLDLMSTLSTAARADSNKRKELEMVQITILAVPALLGYAITKMFAEFEERTGGHND